ncbi:MAG TPA: TonB-dependent receptor [Terriglobales bacterium]|nr:TonB-dependent receptor [Terriglobales bacterium]
MRLVVTLLFAATLALAQTALQGTVRGAGIPLPGATVTATQASTTLSTITDDHGAYTLTLAAGDWTITAAMTGFVSQTHPSTTPDFDLVIAPYTGPASVPTAPPPSPTANEQPAPAARASSKSSPRSNSPAAAANPAPAPAPAQPEALAINGSVDNGAASPFAQAAAFGNFRRNSFSLYNGAFGFTLDNSALDARSFSLSGQNTPRPSYNNLTGIFQFGGPLRIPHLLNANNAPNVFVFYQKELNQDITSTAGLVPTLAERQGDLSALGAPSIAPGNISPQAAALLALYPLPNLTGNPQFNFQVPLTSNTHQDSLQTRVSKTFNRQNQVFGTAALQSTRSDAPSIFNFLDTRRTLGWNSSLTWRHSFTQRIYTTFTGNFSRQTTQSLPFFAGRQNVSAAAGILGNDQTPLDWGPPSLSFSSGFASLRDADPANNRNQTAAFSVSTYINRNDHNFQFGGDLRRLEFNYFQQQNPRGSFTFNGAATGNDFADFLRGTPDTASIAFGNADKYFRESSYDLFFTDDWRLNSSVTLNLGARWEYSAPVSELYNRLVNLNITGDFTAAAPVVGTGAAQLHPDRHAIEPRLALAWRPLAASSLIIHAGYGVYYDTSVYPNIALEMSQQFPLSTSLSLANTAATPLSLATAFQSPPAATPDTFAVDPNFRIGYAQTWNASAQRDLPGALVGTISYLGTKGTRAPQRFFPNTVAPGAVNPCPACPVGFLYLTSNGNSTLESGKATIQRRFRSGFSANLTYTYAHAIDDASLGGSQSQSAVNSPSTVVAQNWRNLDGERARSSFDQRHNVNLTAQYSTGVGIHGGALLKGWKGAAYKGWTLTTMLNGGSGFPLTPQTFLTVPGTAFTGIRPDVTGVAFPNPAAYTLPPAGQFGTAGRNSITGPNQFFLNASMQRSFQATDRITATLRFDAMNVLNHANFPSLDTLFGSAQFGTPLAASPMRSIQTTLRFTY